MDPCATPWTRNSARKLKQEVPDRTFFDDGRLQISEVDMRLTARAGAGAREPPPSRRPTWFQHVFAQPLSQLIAVVQQKGFQLNGCCCGFLRKLEIDAAIGPKVGDSKIPQGTLVNDVKLRLIG